MTQNLSYFQPSDRPLTSAGSPAVPGPTAAGDQAADRAAEVVVTGGTDDGDVLLDLARAALVETTETPSPQRLADLEARIRRAVRRGRSEATLRAYSSDWTDFATWCRTVRLAALPATGATVAGYVSELAFPPDDRSPAAVSTITRRLAAIGQVHQLAGHPNPAAETIVREAMRGIRRALGVAPVQKRAVTTADIATAVAQLDEVALIDLRDRVILLVGFAGGMRRSELAGINVDDVTSAPEGLLIRLRRSKTDPEGRGRRIEIVYGTTPATCPCGPSGRGPTPPNSPTGPSCAGSTATDTESPWVCRRLFADVSGDVVDGSWWSSWGGQGLRRSSMVMGSSQQGQVAAGADSAHEGPAVASLLAEEPGVAGGAFVDGAGFGWPGWGERLDAGGRRLVAAAPGCLAASVAAGGPGASGRQQTAAHHTVIRYVAVT